MLVHDMAGAEKVRETQLGNFPMDLLQRFIPVTHFQRKFEGKTEEKEENLELSLGLSLNGRFGVDPEKPKNLIRSSSISNFNFISTDESKVGMVGPLGRTCSLPAETAEDWKRRKELESMRRMEAKRKRLEKLKNVRVVRGKVYLEENDEGLLGINGNGGGIEWKGERGSGLDGGEGLVGLQPLQPSLEGSIGSQGSGSSDISEFESQPIRGTNKYTELRSPASVQSLTEQKPVVTSGTTNNKPGKLAGAAMENPSTEVTAANREANGTVRNTMADMPCVSTRGDGPNGKRIEGFLYRYRKGEEVRIVCVCHGSFLSPAEFVKHAGGIDVAHPLRHIVVNPSPIS